MLQPDKPLYSQVLAMHLAFGSPVADSPQLLSGAGDVINRDFARRLDELVQDMKLCSKEGHGGQVLARTSWVLEEMAEFLQADTIEDQADALGDADVFINGTYVEMGVQPKPITNAIMGANMGKLWEDGKPRFDAQGKWIKPPGWADKHAPEPKIRKAIYWQRVEATNCPECGSSQRLFRRIDGVRHVFCGECFGDGTLIDIGEWVNKNAVR